MNNEYVVAQIKEMLNLTEEDSITFGKFNKNNGLILDGCNIRVKDEAISPNIYFDINKPDDYFMTIWDVTVSISHTKKSVRKTGALIFLWMT